MRLPLLLAALTALATPLAGQATPTATLLATDRAAAESSAACGYRCALAGVMAAEALYLHEGMPVLQGADLIGRFLEGQAAVRERRVQWLPLHGESSADGQMGVTWGVMTAAAGGAPARFGNYISMWQREGSGWRMVAHVQGALPGVSDTARPARPLAPLTTEAATRPFIEADRAFAAQAGRDGAATAFAAFAAADAVTFSSTGALNRGPAAIRQGLSGGPPLDWAWGPVAGGASPDGSLGFTVGEATIRRREVPGSAPFLSKYLTVWRRDPQGEVRFITDDGNGRPPS